MGGLWSGLVVVGGDVLAMLFTLVYAVKFSRISFGMGTNLGLDDCVNRGSSRSRFGPKTHVKIKVRCRFGSVVSLRPSLFFSRGKTGCSDKFSKGVVSTSTSIGVGRLCLRLPIGMRFHFGVTSGAGLIVTANPCLTYKMNNGTGFSNSTSIKNVRVGNSSGVSAFNSSKLSCGEFSTK